MCVVRGTTLPAFARTSPTIHEAQALAEKPPDGDKGPMNPGAPGNKGPTNAWREGRAYGRIPWASDSPAGSVRRTAAGVRRG
jgi:hypothetical protein